MALKALPASILKKLNRRLKQHEGYRLRGRHTIELRFSQHGQRIAKTFSASNDVFENLEAALQWQKDWEATPHPSVTSRSAPSSPFRSWTVINLLELFQDHHNTLGKTSYHSHFCSLLNQTAKFPFLSCRLTEMKASDVRSFREAMKATRLKGATINKRLGLIEAAINFLNCEHDADLVNYASSRYVKRIEHADKRRSRRISDEELTLILRQFKGPTARHAAALIRFCFHQGTRRSEAFNMTWGDVDFDNHAIRFPKHKTMNYDQELGGQVRVMTGKARELLLRLREEAGRVTASQKVFNAYARVDGYSLAFRRATKEAGLKDIRLHNLRHEATTRIAALCGHNTSLIKRVTGHRDDASLARYTHTSTNSIAMLMSRNAIQHE